MLQIQMIWKMLRIADEILTLHETIDAGCGTAHVLSIDWKISQVVQWIFEGVSCDIALASDPASWLAGNYELQFRPKNCPELVWPLALARPMAWLGWAGLAWLAWPGSLAGWVTMRN